MAPLNLQKGSAILLTTCVLLAIAFVMILGSSQQMLFQLQQVNNYIESRQNYWLAVGAIECGLKVIQEDESLLDDVNEEGRTLFGSPCTLDGVEPRVFIKREESSTDELPVEEHWVLQAQAGYTVLATPMVRRVFNNDEDDEEL